MDHMTAGQQRDGWRLCSTLDLAVSSSGVAGPLRGTEGTQRRGEDGGFRTRAGSGTFELLPSTSGRWVPSEPPPPHQASTLRKHGFSESLKLEFLSSLDEKASVLHQVLA